MKCQQPGISTQWNNIVFQYRERIPPIHPETVHSELLRLLLFSLTVYMRSQPFHHIPHFQHDPHDLESIQILHHVPAPVGRVPARVPDFYWFIPFAGFSAPAIFSSYESGGNPLLQITAVSENMYLPPGCPVWVV